jgi:Uma2 family endonuclease
LEALSTSEFAKIFNRAYRRFRKANKLESSEEENLICAREVTLAEFDRLTENKQYARYISLIDGRIIFHEVPNAPHGQIIDYLAFNLNTQLDRQMFLGAVDNGSYSPRPPLFSGVAYILDIPLTTRSKKRPDYSWQLRKPRIPNPPPAWMKFLPDGLPYPNIVIEVAVNHESLDDLLAYANNYFSALSSIRVWIAVKVWLQEKKFWVGWGERAPTGIGATIHTAMAWPPHHSDLNTPVNLVYSIPMAVVYGTGVPIPPNSPPTLDINVEEIRQVIVEVLM